MRRILLPTLLEPVQPESEICELFSLDRRMDEEVGQQVPTFFEVAAIFQRVGHDLRYDAKVFKLGLFVSRLQQRQTLEKSHNCFVFRFLAQTTDEGCEQITVQPEFIFKVLQSIDIKRRSQEDLGSKCVTGNGPPWREAEMNIKCQIKFL